MYLSAGKTFMVNNILFLDKALFSSIRILRVVLIVLGVKTLLFVEHAHEKACFLGLFFVRVKKVFLMHI